MLGITNPEVYDAMALQSAAPQECLPPVSDNLSLRAAVNGRLQTILMIHRRVFVGNQGMCNTRARSGFAVEWFNFSDMHDRSCKGVYDRTKYIHGYRYAHSLSSDILSDILCDIPSKGAESAYQNARVTITTRQQRKDAMKRIFIIL